MLSNWAAALAPVALDAVRLIIVDSPAAIIISSATSKLISLSVALEDHVGKTVLYICVPPAVTVNVSGLLLFVGLL